MATNEVHADPADQSSDGPEAPIRTAGDAAENAPPASSREMFEAKFHRLMDGFGEACESEQVGLAIAIALDPDSKQPVIFTRGENYDLLKLMKWVYVRLRQQLLDDLSL